MCRSRPSGEAPARELVCLRSVAAVDRLVGVRRERIEHVQDESQRSNDKRPLLVILALTVAVGGAFVLVRPLIIDVLNAWGDVDAGRVPRLCGWVVSVLVLLPAMMAGAFFSVAAVRRCTREAKGLVRLAPFAVVAIGLALYFVLGGSDLSRSDPQALAVYRLLGPDDPALAELRRVGRALAAMGPAFAVVALFGMGALACVRSDDGPERLRERSAELRMLLYVASVAMVGGTITTLYRLQLQITPELLALLADAEPTELAKRTGRLDIAHAVALTYGGLYSIFLVIGFVPAWLGLRASILRAATGETPQERKSWLEEHDLQPRLSSHALTMGAALAPFLAASLEGSFGAVLSAVGGG